VLVKLWSTGLMRVYKLLFCYVAFDALSSVALVYIPYHTYLYGIYYFSAQGVKIIIAACVSVEIYSLALEHHPALARFVRSGVGYILLAAAFIPLIFEAVNPVSSGAEPIRHAYLLFEQTMNATIAIFLILITIFMAWFPVRMRRNVIVYIGGFVVWTLTRSAALHLANQFHGNRPAIHAVNSVLNWVVIACLLLWLVGLRRGGESRTTVVGHLWNRAEGQRLAEQLEAINDSLERMRRK